MRTIYYVETGGHIKLITPLTILNKNFHEMDFIREAMKKRKFSTERLYEDYRTMYKTHIFT